MLDERKAEILRALVEEHIQTGEPVSSRGILDASGLAVSTATVRNELSALESDGFVVQPHTSAGRIPTASAYRFYVDHLSRPALRPKNADRISEFFSSVHVELTRLLRSTTSLLTEITHYPAVVTGPGLVGETVRGLHLVQVSADAILAVLVTAAGRVSQEIARLDTPADPGQVEAAERLLLQAVVDAPLAGEVVNVDTGEVPEAVRRIVEAVCGGIFGHSDHVRDLYVGSTSEMTSAWADISKVRGVLEVLEREAALLEVLAQVPDGTAVQIGQDLGLEVDADIALVSTSYGSGGERSGRVGVIGPMRMDYGRAITVVEEVGDGLGESLSGETS